MLVVEGKEQSREGVIGLLAVLDSSEIFVLVNVQQCPFFVSDSDISLFSRSVGQAGSYVYGSKGDMATPCFRD